MATATKDVEQIVRKVMSEELDETVNAIQELSALLTDQVIPKLSGDDNADDQDQDDDQVADEESEQDDGVSMSAFSGNGASGRRRGKPNGHDDSEGEDDADQPGDEVPEAVNAAFTELYRTLSPEQTKAFAELFTAMDNELEGEHDTEAAGRG